jgi:hypothetical protein
LGNCRAVLGVEAGVSVFDIDDVVVPACERLLREEPDLSFDQVYERLLQPYDGTGVAYRTVSPRVFEAAATGTCQILYEGHYSGVVQAGVHYLMLRKDFSNFDEVLRQYRDEGVRQAVVANAERDLIAAGTYSYRRFMAHFDAGLLAAGLVPTIAEATVQHVSDTLRENERELWLQKLQGQQAEYDQLLQQHIALQVQYMAQAQVLAQAPASREASPLPVALAAPAEDSARWLAQLQAQQAEYTELLQQHIALQERYMAQAQGLAQAPGRRVVGQVLCAVGGPTRATRQAARGWLKGYLAQRLAPYPWLYGLGRWVLRALRPGPPAR